MNKRDDRSGRDSGFAIFVVAMCVILTSPVVALYVGAILNFPAWPYGG